MLDVAGIWGVFAVDVSPTLTAMRFSYNFSKIRRVCQVKTDQTIGLFSFKKLSDFPPFLTIRCGWKPHLPGLVPQNPPKERETK